MSLRFARVVAVYPKRRTVDLVFTDNGQRMGEVQVMGDVGSTTGSWHVPNVPRPDSEAKPDVLGKGQNLTAVVAMAGGRPLVQGFVAPLGTEMGFDEQNRSIHRHVSGAYTTIAPDGSIESFHPSGAFLRIGAGDHQDLAGVTAGGAFTVPAGAAPAQITLNTAGFKLTIEPNGATTLVTGGELHITYGKAFLTGDVSLQGSLEVSGEVTAQAGSGGSVTLSKHKGHIGGGGQPPTAGT